MSTQSKLPSDREPTLKLTTNPSDANPGGDIFGGWLMSQMDIAGAIAAYHAAGGPISTVAVKELQFIRPLFVYDIVSFYTKVEKIGTSSVTISVEVFAQRRWDITESIEKISDAILVYVAVDKPGKKRIISK